MTKNSHWITLAIVVPLAATFGWWMFSTDEELGGQGYEITVALYAACNTKSEQRLASIETLVQSSLTAHEIDEGEAELFQGVIQSARKGNWRAATVRSHQLLQAQMGS